jgi:FimV-like protein
MKRSLVGLALVLAVLPTSVTVAFAADGPKTLYDTAIEAYRNAHYDAALETLGTLRREFPGDRLAEDSLLYIGRIHARAGRRDKAIEAFQAVLAMAGRDALRREASYDLAQLYFKSGDYESAASVLQPISREDSDTARDEKAVRLLARTRLQLGLREMRNFHDEDARKSLEESARLFELLLARQPGGPDPGKDLAGRGESYARLAALASSGDDYQRRTREAQLSLSAAASAAASEKERTKLLGLLSGVGAADKPRVTGSVLALGGAESASVTGSSILKPGALVQADLTLLLPLGWQQQLALSAGFTHDDWVLKTYAYSPAIIATGAARLDRTENTASAEIAWEAGSPRAFLSTLALSGAYTLADDPANDTWMLKASEKLAWRVNPAWKLGFDLDGRWVAYPNYTSVSGRGLDYMSTSANPHVTWYFLPDLSLGLGYDFTFKQFLNAKYDVLAGAGPPPVVTASTLDKQYFTNSANLILRATPGSVFRPYLGYSFTYNKTANNDLLLTGTPVSQFVTGEYDYFEHKVRAGTKLLWSPDFTTALDASLSYRPFLTYPAQDPTQAFTGSLRADLVFDVTGELQYRVWNRAGNGIGDLYADLRVSYRAASSTELYEHLHQTNYQTFGGFAGLDLVLP